MSRIYQVTGHLKRTCLAWIIDFTMLVWVKVILDMTDSILFQWFVTEEGIVACGNRVFQLGLGWRDIMRRRVRGHRWRTRRRGALNRHSRNNTNTDQKDRVRPTYTNSSVKAINSLQ